MKKGLCIGIIVWCLVGRAKAQQINDDVLTDSIKAGITNFFIKEGLLDKNTVKNRRNYVYATELKHKRWIGYDSNGIYRIGLNQSHSPEHLLIKQQNEFRIFDLDEISKVIKEVISYSEENNIDAETMLDYVKEVMNIYHNNRKPVNSKVNKMR